MQILKIRENHKESKRQKNRARKHRKYFLKN